MNWAVLEGFSSSASLPDTNAFLGKLASIKNTGGAQHEEQIAAGIFSWDQELYVARAPGRLDVMGGIADYSGSLVLQMPIAEACHVALQLQKAAEPRLRIMSFHSDVGHRAPMFEAPVSDLFPSGQPLEYSQARTYFMGNPQSSWAAYIAGCLLVLAREGPVPQGAASVAAALAGCSVSICVCSEVPEGKGVSSSASVEVATMSALTAALGVRLEGRQLAILCQKVENLVVGAPCGIMDQMASALGQAGQLLALLCQPAEVQGCVPLPDCVAVWGVDSGIRHSVGGSDYGSVRVGAFMGLRIASSRGQNLEATGGVAPAPLHGGYLVNMGPSQLEGPGGAAEQLPASIKGSDFIEQYGSHYDSVTHIDPGQEYAVRVPASHPVHEHFRVRAYRQLLQRAQAAGAGSAEAEECGRLLGELMMQSHASYGACGLGSDGTDMLVSLVREEMAAAAARSEALPLYGAKITGGGSGGTVCILGTAGPAGKAAVERVVSRYAQATQRDAAGIKVFEGSSVGADAFGYLKVRFS